MKHTPRRNGDALRFMYNLEPELLQLQRELETGSYRAGPCRCGYFLKCNAEKYFASVDHSILKDLLGGLDDASLTVVP